MKNNFYKKVQDAEFHGASTAELESLLGKGRAKRGMFEGDMEEGELEIGQVSALIRDIIPARDVVKHLWEGYNEVLNSYRK